MVETRALIDSGAAGNFIDINFANLHELPLLSCESRLAVAALDGWPLGTGRIKFTTQDLILKVGSLHIESICFFALTHHRTQSFSSYPGWRSKILVSPGPVNRSNNGQITVIRNACNSSLTLLLPNLPHHQKSQSDLPAEYQDLSEAFSKSRASQLPPHRSSDCAIDLLPGATPTRGRVFPLSQPESEAMKAYIDEELAKGFIRPSTSPASAGFFFV